MLIIDENNQLVGTVTDRDAVLTRSRPHEESCTVLVWSVPSEGHGHPWPPWIPDRTNTFEDVVSLNSNAGTGYAPRNSKPS